MRPPEPSSQRLVDPTEQAPAPPGAPVGGASSTSKKLGGMAAVFLAILAKGKTLLGIVKALPFAKLFLTAGTMGLSIFAYASRGGLAFAIAFVLLIFVHEMGHAMALREAKIPAGWPVFIPFLGAFISMKGAPAHPRVEARVAFAGPLAGTGGALVCAAIGLAFHSPLFLSLAYTGFFLNLFNLVPFGFLDGARIARMFSRGAWIVGIALMGGLFFLSPSPQLIIIALMGAGSIFRRDDDNLSLVTPAERREWALKYFGLCLFLGLALLTTTRLLGKQGW